MMKSINNILFTVLLLFLFTVVIFGKSTDQFVKKHDIRQLTCQAPPRDALTGDLINPNKPIYRDSFAPVEMVWIALNSNIFSERNKKAKIHVVPHKALKWQDKVKFDDIVCSQYAKTIECPFGTQGMIYIPIWLEPNSRLLKEKCYDVFVNFPPFDEYNMGEDIVDGIDNKGFYFPKHWIYLDRIVFDHNPDCNFSDAIATMETDLFNRSISNPRKHINELCYPAVFAKNKSITIKAIFHSSNLITETNILAREKTGELGNLIETEKKLVGEDKISGIKTWNITFQLFLPTPKEITFFLQEWKWFRNNCNQEEYIGNTINRIFIVLFPPQTPWVKNESRRIWWDTLQLCCLWAQGETTPEGTAAKITHHLFNLPGIVYSQECDRFYIKSRTSGAFYLQKFLNDFHKKRDVNCYEMAKALVTFSNAVGCGLNYRYCSEFGNSLNCIITIGDKYVCSGKYGNHAFGSIGDKIFDPTFLYVSREDIMNDGIPHKFKKMVNISWKDYKENIIKIGDANYPILYLFNIEKKISTINDNDCE